MYNFIHIFLHSQTFPNIRSRDDRIRGERPPQQTPSESSISAPLSDFQTSVEGFVIPPVRSRLSEFCEPLRENEDRESFRPSVLDVIM